MNSMRQATNRRWIVTVYLLAALSARANPVMIHPSSLIAFGVVATWALVVEAGIVALLLAFNDLAPLRIFGGLLVTNVAVFLFVFSPLLGRVPLVALETLVVAADAIAIKLLSCFSGFQQENFRSVTWLRAGLLSVVGNAVSFFVGVVAAGAPWEDHGLADN